MKRRLLPILLIPLLLVFVTTVVLSQSAPVWQTAESIRDALFQAQQEMYSAARADDPQANYDTAVSHIQTAADAYTANFQPHFAAEVDSAVMAALADAETAAANGEAARLASARGRVWTGLLWGSFLAADTAVANNDPTTASNWLSLREYRESTRVNVIDDAAVQAIVALQAGELTVDAAHTAVTNDLRDTYFFRLRDSLNELETAVDKAFPTRAAEWAGQANGYFAILQADMTAKMGDEAVAEIAQLFLALEETAVSADWTAISTNLTAIRTAISNYQPVQFSAAEVAEREQLLYLFTDLIIIEYANGVRDGRITIPIEYQEATTFRTQAESVFEELRPVIAANDPAAADRLAQLYAEMEIIIADLGPVDDIDRMVAEALSLIEVNLEVKPDLNDPTAAFIVVDTLLNDLIVAVEQGDYAQAEQNRLEAYAMFESGPEQRLANRAPLLTRTLEGLFWEGTGGEPGLAVLLREEADVATIEAHIEELRVHIAEAESFLATGLTGTLAAVNSAVIIIREGLEAVLIVGAILGYMRATAETKQYTRWVYIGVIAAIALSLVTWWASLSLITISVANRELIEGVTSLLAVVVLFYVTNWLFHKVYVIDWATFVKEKVGKALTTGSALTLAGLGFTVVYREGFETVLFYQALLFDADGTAVLAGFLVGLLIFIAVAYAILRMSKQLPLKTFFTVTGILLMLLAFNFTGAGIRELQEAGVVPSTLLTWMPENLILMETMGIFPTMETTLAQAVFLIALVVTFVISRWQGRRQVTAVATGD
ncbi:MAG TPA: FTR1 family iron permease [Chromatiaceae bacterium]|nr:FTR1 family iron permease [Chromatiaceae bacterium]